MAAAKRQYLGSLSSVTPYDEKSSIQFTMYGMPQYRLPHVTQEGTSEIVPQTLTRAASSRLLKSAEEAAAQGDIPFPAGCIVEIVDPAQTGPRFVNATLEMVEADATSRYVTAQVEGSDQPDTQATADRPIQPRIVIDLGAEGADPVKAAVLEEGVYADIDPFNPAISRWTNEWEVNVGEFQVAADGWWPASPAVVSTIDTPSGREQRLIVVPGQFLATSAADDPVVVGTERIWTSLKLRLVRGSDTDTIAPTVRSVVLTNEGHHWTATIDAEDPSWVTRLDVTQVGAATAEPFHLEIAPGTPGPYNVEFDLPLVESGEVNVQVAVTDGAGNTTTVTGRGLYVTPGPTGTFLLNGGAANTHGRQVTVDSEVVHADEMRTSTDGKATWSDWRPYAANVSVRLPATAGVSMVWAQYRNSNPSVLETSDDIELLPYTISVGITGAGTVTHGPSSGDAPVVDGEDMSFALTPHPGQRLADVTVDGQSLLQPDPPTTAHLSANDDGSYSCKLIDVASDHALDVTFAESSPGTFLISHGAPIQANGNAFSCALSADGRYVAFSSEAPNVVPGDSNGVTDVFVRDLLLGYTERVSVDSTGLEGNGDSLSPSISADGQYVAFTSAADNLVSNDTNPLEDVFVHDRATGITELISVDTTAGGADNESYTSSISADGRYVAFDSDASDLVPDDTNGLRDVFVRDCLGHSTVLASADAFGLPGNGLSGSGVISGDGRIVAFASEASDLVPLDLNLSEDVFVRDLTTGTTERISVGATNNEGDSGSSRPSISSGGQIVAFSSHATNLVANDINDQPDIFVRDRDAGETRLVSVSVMGDRANGYCESAAISPDGRYVAFSSAATTLYDGDTDGVVDVFVADLVTEAIEQVSRPFPNGPSHQPSISDEGERVAYLSEATNLVTGDTNGATDVIVRYRSGGPTAQRVSVGSQSCNNSAESPVISGNGRFVAFSSGATNLVPDDTNARYDLFVRDTITGATELVSVSSSGVQANGSSSGVKASFSADGRYVVFGSLASNLVPGDCNSGMNFFVRDRDAGTTELVTVPVGETSAWGNSSNEVAVLSADGRYVAFCSLMENLVPGETPSNGAIFRRDLVAGTTELISGGSAPSISADGRYVAYSAGWYWGLHVHDCDTGTTERVDVSSSGDPANAGLASTVAISGNGRFVAFDTFATNLVPGDTSNVDVFVHDRVTGRTERVSVSTNGIAGNGSSYGAAISDDGRYVAFYSQASNLVPADADVQPDVFVHDRLTGRTEQVDVATDGSQGDAGSASYPSMSGDGRCVVFTSWAANFAPGDTNGTGDAFVRVRW